MIAQHFVELIADELKVKPEVIVAAITLFNKGATIPFVARYRKDITGGLSESKLERIEERNDYFIALSSRKNAILDNIEKQGRLTDELRAAFETCHDHVALEDLSLPFKKQRNNRAAIAANKGLLPLADYIWAQSPTSPPPILYAESFVGADKQVLSVEEALEGARPILAECIAMNADIRREIRQTLFKEGFLTVHPTRIESDKPSKFNHFKNFSHLLEEVSETTLLTILKGEQESAFRVDLVVDDDRLIQSLASRFVQNPESAYAGEILAAVTDAYKRLLRPVIEEEVFTKVRRNAEDVIIANCRDHLRNLLLTAPAGPIPVIGICCWSPQVRAFAAVDDQGVLLSASTVEADSEEEILQKTEEFLGSFLESHPSEGIGISSGPGGRETLRIVQAFLRGKNLRTFAALVQDAGLAAWVHSSHSSEELPDTNDKIRAAVSIARRLQDPLHELVKAEPCSLIPLRLTPGVNRRRLQSGAIRTIESVVNRIGVDVNTASVELLRYVSGLQTGVAQALVEKRTQTGKFTNRTNLLDVSGIGEKTYQQCAAFLRINDGENPLDGSAIHPESYPLVDKIISTLGSTLAELREKPETLRTLDLPALADDTTGPLALEDICYELGRIGREPRRRFRPPQNLVSLNTLEDLEANMVLEGIVTNITDFGIFVSLGLPQEGLVHRSEVGRNILNDPKRALQVGDVVRVLVMQVDKESKKIALSIRAASKLPLTRPSRQFRRPEDRADIPERAGRDQWGRGRPTRQEDDRRDRFRNVSQDQNRPQRRHGKGTLAIPRIGQGEKKKEGANLLNTSLADQLAALRDKIISTKK